MMDLYKLTKWVQESNGKRICNVTIGQFDDKDYFKIWVYDGDAMCGTHIKITDEIPDLKKLKAEEDLEEYNKLKNKFENK